MGILAPAGTPDAVVRRINTEVGEALASAEMTAVLGKLGFDPMAMTPEQFAAFIAVELKKWPPLLQAAGLKAEWNLAAAPLRDLSSLQGAGLRPDPRLRSCMMRLSVLPLRQIRTSW